MAYAHNDDKSRVEIYTAQEIDTKMNLKANLENPAFTGTPTTPTAGNGTNNKQIASTAFVRNLLDAFFPVGCVFYTNGGSTPSIGTWTRIGSLSLEYGGVAYNVAAYKRTA